MIQENSERHLLRSLQASNASDAAGREFVDSSMSIIAISILGFSTTQIGVLDFLEAGAAIFLALPIGLLVDRYKPQTVLTLSLALKVLLGASLCLGLHFGLEKPAFFMAIVFFLGVSIIASENAQTSLVPFIARSDGRIENTVSRMAMADSIAGVVAPAAAGLALTFFGTTPTTGVAILFFALSLFFALRILQRLRQHQFSSNQNTTIDAVDESNKAAQPRKDNRPLSQKLTDGFRILGTNRFLLGAVCLISAGNVGLALSDSMVNVVILRVLDLGMPFFGILGTVSAAIGILAAAIAPRIMNTIPVRTLYIWSSITQAIVACLPILALLIPSWARALFLIQSVCWAFTLTIANIAGFSYVAKAVDKEYLGRTSAAMRMVTMGTVPFAALLGGVLADVGAITVPLIIWPVLTATAVTVYIILTRQSA
ncbi:MFS transporter [Brevibacterium ravenspurgense]|uniref:MFS transporter n=2 Tax=Brevibacterium ravenspurgense TaxID=479117 RepID=A0A2I1IGX8_9MICO|nr:MFS transporter [Brevibacterium ravenspurgense]PKY70390.1 MFS transporter [Brevibacterium ravenspurgense]